MKLPDGTRILLNTASAIDVRYDDGERRVVLCAGEILVSTAADPALVYRPFLVQTREGTARALGTRFTVRQQDGVSSIAVLEGAVMVRPARPGAREQRIDAGQQTELRTDAASPPQPTDEGTARLVAPHAGGRTHAGGGSPRRTGARYRPGVLRCDAEVAELSVSGVFPLSDTDRALANLTLGAAGGAGLPHPVLGHGAGALGGRAHRQSFFAALRVSDSRSEYQKENRHKTLGIERTPPCRAAVSSRPSRALQARSIPHSDPAQSIQSNKPQASPPARHARSRLPQPSGRPCWLPWHWAWAAPPCRSASTPSPCRTRPKPGAPMTSHRARWTRC
ncbi:FecR family protein [Cupriavidus basilensis]